MPVRYRRLTLASLRGRPPGSRHRSESGRSGQLPPPKVSAMTAFPGSGPARPGRPAQPAPSREPAAAPRPTALRRNRTPVRRPFGADQLRALLDAQQVITSDLSLSDMLDRIVRTACELVAARHGTLGVHSGSGQVEHLARYDADTDADTDAEPAGRQRRQRRRLRRPRTPCARARERPVPGRADPGPQPGDRRHLPGRARAGQLHRRGQRPGRGAGRDGRDRHQQRPPLRRGPAHAGLAGRVRGDHPHPARGRRDRPARAGRRAGHRGGPGRQRGARPACSRRRHPADRGGGRRRRRAPARPVVRARLRCRADRHRRPGRPQRCLRPARRRVRPDRAAGRCSSRRSAPTPGPRARCC